MPVTDTTDDWKMSYFPNCSICFDIFEEFANIAACACGHTFHHDCIVDWAKHCQDQGQPALCPTCKKCFETNAACGIVKKLYFTFDSSRSRSSAATVQVELERRIEFSEELLREVESRDVEIQALRRELDLTESLLKSSRSAKATEMVELEDKLRVANGNSKEIRHFL